MVSVIVPARNEETCLGRCLESLAAQTGVSFEIIVVDDGSTDRTREIAQSFPGVRLLEPGPLPPCWSGKNNALVAGAGEARGEWLLFTDADTVHRAESLARAVAEAQQQKAALLSYSPEQEVRGFWEKAVMPVIFAELASTYRPTEVSDPRSAAAAANGQYILVSREAYDAAGGHAAVGASLLEDVALARAVKASGRQIFFRYGGDAVRTRMYRSFAQLREGWTKNLALLFPKPIALALWRILDLLLFVGLPALALGIFWLVPWQRWVILLIWARTLWRFYSRVARSNFPAWDVTISILGIPMFVYLLIRSVVYLRIKKNVVWKGRSYSTNR